jgi:hypothetical protein
MHRRWRDTAMADSADPGMFPLAAREDGHEDS